MDNTILKILATNFIDFKTIYEIKRFVLLTFHCPYADLCTCMSHTMVQLAVSWITEFPPPLTMEHMELEG